LLQAVAALGEGERPVAPATTNEETGFDAAPGGQDSRAAGRLANGAAAAMRRGPARSQRLALQQAAMDLERLGEECSAWPNKTRPCGSGSKPLGREAARSVAGCSRAVRQRGWRAWSKTSVPAGRWKRLNRSNGSPLKELEQREIALENSRPPRTSSAE